MVPRIAYHASWAGPYPSRTATFTLAGQHEEPATRVSRHGATSQKHPCIALPRLPAAQSPDVHVTRHGCDASPAGCCAGALTPAASGARTSRKWPRCHAQRPALLLLFLLGVHFLLHVHLVIARLCSQGLLRRASPTSCCTKHRLHTQARGDGQGIRQRLLERK